MIRELRTDILVVGGGLGGVAAAHAALTLGRKVVLTEETDWIGGQLTAQAVPPDEHPWIEGTGCTASHQRLRRGITLVNWPQNDYWLGPLAGVPEDERQRNLRGAQQLSLSLLYWMQTEAPRLDGGTGYRGLRLRHDVVGTRNGLAKHVYVRESRRIRAEFTVLEQHVGVDARGAIEGAEPFPDSVGVGSYRLDLHPTTRQPRAKAGAKHAAVPRGLPTHASCTAGRRARMAESPGYRALKAPRGRRRRDSRSAQAAILTYVGRKEGDDMHESDEETRAKGEPESGRDTK